MATVRASVPSPCVAVCIINTETRFCLGCYRTIEEIGRWTMMDDDQRRAVVDAVQQRRAEDPDRKPAKKKPTRQRPRK